VLLPSGTRGGRSGTSPAALKAARSGFRRRTATAFGLCLAGALLLAAVVDPDPNGGGARFAGTPEPTARGLPNAAAGESSGPKSTPHHPPPRSALARFESGENSSELSNLTSADRRLLRASSSEFAETVVLVPNDEPVQQGNSRLSSTATPLPPKRPRRLRSETLERPGPIEGPVIEPIEFDLAGPGGSEPIAMEAPQVLLRSLATC
jgi:hypothetical protein